MGEFENMTPKEKRLALHLRIWLTGLIALGFYIGINYFLSDTYALNDALYQSAIFFTAWIIVNYLIYKKTFKQFKQEQNQGKNDEDA